jgi:hypothetical protein
MLLSLRIAPHHGRTVWLGLGDIVYHVIGPVERLRIMQRQVRNLTVAVAAFTQIVLT